MVLSSSPRSARAKEYFPNLGVGVTHRRVVGVDEIQRLSIAQRSRCRNSRIRPVTRLNYG